MNKNMLNMIFKMIMKKSTLILLSSSEYTV
jgi:hypothetical protein